jgi:hypothetical protein
MLPIPYEMVSNLAFSEEFSGPQVCVWLLHQRRHPAGYGRARPPLVASVAVEGRHEETVSKLENRKVCG